MSIDYFTSKLAHVASIKYQFRYGVLATKDIYLLPADLLQDAWECVEKLDSKNSVPNSPSRTAKSFSPIVKKHLQKIEILLLNENAHSLENQNWSDLLTQTG